MTLPQPLITHGRQGLVGAALAILLGWIMWHGRIGNALVYFSYDSMFRLRLNEQALSNELHLIYLDERAFDRWKRTPSEWEPSLHAALLDRLTTDGARAVVFDIILVDPQPDEEKETLARAIKKNGRVLLASTLEKVDLSERTVRPLPEFTKAAGIGIAKVVAGTDNIVRFCHPGFEDEPSLPRVAAALAHPEVSAQLPADLLDCWLNFYGQPGALGANSYADFDRQESGFYSNKVVFIGSKPASKYAFSESDHFPTPYARWDYGYTPGVELMATAYLNLVQQEWLRRWPRPIEGAFLIGTGLFLGFFLPLLRPLRATLAALTFLAAVLALVIYLFWTKKVWMAWTIIAAIEIPTALAWTYICHFRKVIRERDQLIIRLSTGVDTARPFKPGSTGQPGAGALSAPQPPKAGDPAAGSPDRIPVIPDHTLVRRIGRGAYGEVWMARNAIGTYHAVKVVYRDAFDQDVPYEREFKGIQKFMPISHRHPGWVHVLHVGRKDDLGCFYYVMEIGDDEKTGPQIIPETYVPKNLASEIKRRRRIPAPETLRLTLALTAALEALHQEQLIHRDIKPANIIFVRGEPKLADIGLVTDLAGRGRNVSFLGTEGYIAPEGPGTAGADVYSLGKVVYEACLGMDRELFPEMPTGWTEWPDHELLQGLNRVIGKACETEPAHRYQTAAEMHADLTALAGKP